MRVESVRSASTAARSLIPGGEESDEEQKGAVYWAVEKERDGGDEMSSARPLGVSVMSGELEWLVVVVELRVGEVHRCWFATKTESLFAIMLCLVPPFTIIGRIIWSNAAVSG